MEGHPLIEKTASPLVSDEVRLSHHCTYGSRIQQRFVKYKCNRSLHQLHPDSFKIRLASFILNLLIKFEAHLTFSPSLFCETSLLFPKGQGSLLTTTMTSADFSFGLDKQGDLP